jgi:hypothetical protein
MEFWPFVRVLWSGLGHAWSLVFAISIIALLEFVIQSIVFLSKDVQILTFGSLC